MISGATRGSGGPGLGNHLAADFAQPGESRGLISENIKDQVSELAKIASRAKHSEPLYHCFARPPEGVEWSRDDFQNFWNKFEKEFKLEKQAFSTAIHDSDGHQHRVYSLVKPSGSCLRMDNDFARREKIGRIVEFERGDSLVKGAHNRAVVHALRREGRDDVAMAISNAGLHEGPKPIALLTPQDRHVQERTGIKKSDVAKATGTAWNTSDGPQAFIAALKDAGLTLAQGNKLPVIVDSSGTPHGLTKMLAMASRADGERSPRAADIEARLQGVELPSLAEVRAHAAHVQPVEVAPVITTPDPAPPGGGEAVPLIEVPSSPTTDNGAPFVTATPSNDDGQKVPAAASASAPKPKVGGGGGGGSSASEQSSPLPSLDVGAGPGEPPGHDATPEEKSRFAARQADDQDRRAKAWQSWIRAMDAQNRPKGSPQSGGGNDNAVDEKGIREAASKLIQSIQDEWERRAANSAFQRAWESFRNDEAGRRLEEPRGGSPAPERSPSSGTGRPDRFDARSHDHSDGERRPIGAHGNSSGGGDGHQHAERDERANFTHRTAFEVAIERERRNASASVADMSDLRAAMRGPDPLLGLEGKERRDKLTDLNRELYSEFSSHQKVDFCEQLAREKMRSHPLSRILRDGKKHLSPDERQAAWADIKASHAALVLRLREQQKANGRAAFRQFVQFKSHTDSRAHALWEEMKLVAERNAKIQSELSRGDARILELRALEPTGERDPDKAARAAKSALYEPMKQAQDDVRVAQERLKDTPKPGGFWHFLGLPTKAAKERKAAERALEMAKQHETNVTPHYLEIDSVEGKARNAAVVTSLKHARWSEGPGAELSKLEQGMAGIRDALDNRDYRVRDALLSPDGGLEKALEEVRKREERELRQRAIEEARLQTGKVVEVRFPGNAQGVEMPVPRMR